MKAEDGTAAQRGSRQSITGVILDLNRDWCLARAWAGLRVQNQAPADGLRWVHQQFSLIPDPAIASTIGTLDLRPPAAEADACIGQDNILAVELAEALVGQLKFSIPCEDATGVAFAKIQKLRNRRAGRGIARHIVAIHAVHPLSFQRAFRQESHQLGREDDVEVGSQYEFAACAPDAGVL